LGTILAAIYRKLPHVTQDFLSAERAGSARPLWLVTEATLAAWIAEQPPAVQTWVRQNGFMAERHRVLPLPSAAGGVSGVVVGLGSLGGLDALSLWHAAALPERLPVGAYALVDTLTASAATQFALGWQFGLYRLARYRTGAAPERAQLVAPKAADIEYVQRAARACANARDLINLPANDLGPADLAEAAGKLALQFDAECRILSGAELLTENYPLVYAVGKASPREPRLIDLRCGARSAPKVTIVGKGVCFDTGGLDIKPSSAMLLMKKDMGGAACALALAELLMASGAPIRLRVLIPAVENAIDGVAYRPGDIIRSRKGLTVEIGNTDAEGRLVLADALTAADEEAPDLLIDLATLTGAARVALGPELPAAYSVPATLAEDLQQVGQAEHDPVWPMPLWGGYDDDLASKLAELNNVSASPFAGSIIGALFLKRFVTATPNWLHLDLYAWNPKERPGRPVGAEAQCVRALYQLIRRRYG
jgi:leucyl aminopeptidase